MTMPRLIQGGMGVGVSGWKLAREVASLGQVGVVSGTALDTILIRRLGLGDPGGYTRLAMEAFPAPEIAQRVLARYFRPEGSAERTARDAVRAETGASLGEEDSPDAEQVGGDTRPGQRFTLLPLPQATLTPERQWLLALANFVEVYLAKQGHAGVVGINYLHKIQFPILPSLYGAMLAGVDTVLMGAGIPADIPGLLDRLSRGEAARIMLDVQDAGEQRYEQAFDPAALWAAYPGHQAPKLRRPKFLAIISSATLAKALLKKAPGGIDGFVVEAPIAGGHNAPPRGPQQLSSRGEPLYGPRDEVDMAQMATLGVPFWLAGGYASRERFIAARAWVLMACRSARRSRSARNRGSIPRCDGVFLPSCSAAMPRCSPIRTPRPRVSRSRWPRSRARCRTRRSTRIVRACAILAISAARTASPTVPWATGARASRSTTMCARAARSRTPWDASACATRWWRTSACGSSAAMGTKSLRS